MRGESGFAGMLGYREGYFGSGGFKAGRGGADFAGKNPVERGFCAEPRGGGEGRGGPQGKPAAQGRAALGGRRPPRRRHAAGPAGRLAAAPGGPADKSMAAGGAADAKKRGNPGENANQGLTRGSEVPIIFLCPSKGGSSAPFYPKGRRPLNAAGISPKKRREAP